VSRLRASRKTVSSVRRVAQFILGFLFAGIYLIGIGVIGFILYEHFQTLYLIICAAIIALIPLNIMAFAYCPKILKWGALLPQIIALGLTIYFIGNKEVTPFFTDDIAYQSCVGNFDHGEGISDCTALIYKLENEGGIKLKDIENTKGDYWLAEMLSYRGRHYIRNNQHMFGKGDFARAFLLPEGGAVVAGNLAEAGFIRQELFEADYDKALAELKALLVQENVRSQDEGSNFLKAHFRKTIELCRQSTGREEDNCREIVEKEISEN